MIGAYTERSGIYNLAAGVEVVLDQPQVAWASVYMLRLRVGTIENPCAEVAGVWQLRMQTSGIGGILWAVEPYPQDFYAGNSALKEFPGVILPLMGGSNVVVGVKSPNGADVSVGVTIILSDIAYALPAYAAGTPNGGLPLLDVYGHVSPDTTGIATLAKQDAAALILARMAGLVQENFYIDNYVWSTGRCTSFRMRIYSDAASVGTAANVLATYNVTATYTAGKPASYKVVKA